MSIRSFFGIIFILSILTFGVFKYYPNILNKLGVIESSTPIMDSSKDVSSYQKRYSPSMTIEASVDANNDFIILTSLITSILSFIGFIISTLYSMRTNKREEELYRLRKERERLELEKIQQELRALRGEA